MVPIHVPGGPPTLHVFHVTLIKHLIQIISSLVDSKTWIGCVRKRRNAKCAVWMWLGTTGVEESWLKKNIKITILILTSRHNCLKNKIWHTYRIQPDSLCDTSWLCQCCRQTVFRDKLLGKNNLVSATPSVCTVQFICLDRKIIWFHVKMIMFYKQPAWMMVAYILLI